MAKATDSVSSVFNSSATFPDTAFDESLVQNESIERDPPLDVEDLTSKNDRGTSALQQIREICKTYDLSVPSDVRSVWLLVRDKLAAFNSLGENKTSLAHLKECFAAEKAELESLLVSYEEKLTKA